jgi:hypothetical protein
MLENPWRYNIPSLLNLAFSYSVHNDLLRVLAPRMCTTRHCYICQFRALIQACVSAASINREAVRGGVLQLRSGWPTTAPPTTLVRQC